MSNLSCDDHIANLVSKASRRLHLLRELRRPSLLKTYIRATSPSFAQELSMFAKSRQQHWRASRAMRLRTSSAEPCRSFPPPHKTYEEAQHEHRLVTLQQRRNELCDRLFKDIQNAIHRLNSLLPWQHHPGYQLRHSKKYPLPLVKTNRFKSSPTQLNGFSNLEYSERLRKLNLTTLSCRRARGDMLETVKYMKGQYNTALILHLDTRTHGTTTRGHQLKLEKGRSRLDVRKHFVTQRVVNLWNSLPENVVSAPTVNAFKNQIDKLCKDAPSTTDPNATNIYYTLY